MCAQYLTVYFITASFYYSKGRRDLRHGRWQDCWTGQSPTTSQTQRSLLPDVRSTSSRQVVLFLFFIIDVFEITNANARGMMIELSSVYYYNLPVWLIFFSLAWSLSLLFWSPFFLRTLVSFLPYSFTFNSPLGYYSFDFNIITYSFILLGILSSLSLNPFNCYSLLICLYWLSQIF